MGIFDKKHFLKRFTDRRSAIAAIDVIIESVSAGVLDIEEVQRLRYELVSEDDSRLPTEVLEFLNKVTDSSFRNSDDIKRIVRKLPNVTLDQFKSIILFKTEKWKGDPTMEQYLTPKTLFGSVNKFKTYLDEATNHWIKKAKQNAEREIIRGSGGAAE